MELASGKTDTRTSKDEHRNSTNTILRHSE
jgi:hypothetical protein